MRPCPSPWCALGALLIAHGTLVAQSPPPDSSGALRRAVAEVAQPIVLEAGRLSGQGSAALRDRMAGADWILFGEQHGVAGLGELVAAALPLAAPDALALEMGPWVAEELARRSVSAVVRTAPFSFAFDDDGEFALLEAAATAPGGRIPAWGLDQEITAIHPLAALAGEGRTTADRRLARGVALAAVLRMGLYVRERHDADLRALRTAAWHDSARAERTLAALAVSQEIFALHRGGEPARAAAIREGYLDARFREHVAALRAARERVPRVLVKIGGAHVIRGVEPNGVPSLGDRVQALADTMGARTLMIGIRRYDPARTAFPLAGLFPTADSTATARALWIGTAALRPVLDSLPAPVREAIAPDVLGFDALIYLEGAGPAPRTRARSAEAGWRADTMRTLAVSFGPAALLLLFSLAAPVVVVRGRRRGTDATEAAVVSVVLGIASIGLLAFVAAQLLALRAGLPAGMGPCQSLVPLAPPVLAVLVTAAVAWRARRATRGRAVWYATWCVALLWLAAAAGYWNLGATLGCG